MNKILLISLIPLFINSCSNIQNNFKKCPDTKFYIENPKFEIEKSQEIVLKKDNIYIENFNIKNGNLDTNIYISFKNNLNQRKIERNLSLIQKKLDIYHNLNKELKNFDKVEKHILDRNNEKIIKISLKLENINKEIKNKSHKLNIILKNINNFPKNKKTKEEKLKIYNDYKNQYKENLSIFISKDVSNNILNNLKENFKKKLLTLNIKHYQYILKQIMFIQKSLIFHNNSNFNNQDIINKYINYVNEVQNVKDNLGITYLKQKTNLQNLDIYDIKKLLSVNKENLIQFFKFVDMPETSIFFQSLIKTKNLFLPIFPISKKIIQEKINLTKNEIVNYQNDLEKNMIHSAKLKLEILQLKENIKIEEKELLRLKHNKLNVEHKLNHQKKQKEESINKKLHQTKREINDIIKNFGKDFYIIKNIETSLTKGKIFTSQVFCDSNSYKNNCVEENLNSIKIKANLDFKKYHLNLENYTIEKTVLAKEIISKNTIELFEKSFYVKTKNIKYICEKEKTFNNENLKPVINKTITEFTQKLQKYFTEINN